MARNRSWLVGVLLLAVTGCAGDGGEDMGAAADTMTADTMAAGAGGNAVVVVENAGLQTPESVLHDAAADVYLVSNINGEPLGKDDNGFIARVRPDGMVETLKWIDGASEDVTLHAPKGMALKGDTLFVADIDSVRAFHRQTGEALGSRGVPGAAFLNDLAVGDGVLYVSDMGVDASFSPTGAAAIYRFGPSGAEAVARGDALTSPNGITVAGGDMVMVPFGSADVRRIPLEVGADGASGAGQVIATLPGGQLDGVVRLPAGDLFVSSWETSTVYHVTPQGEAHAVIEGVQSPADIGWDEQRRRILIPVFMGDRLEFHPVP